VVLLYYSTTGSIESALYLLSRLLLVLLVVHPLLVVWHELSTKLEKEGSHSLSCVHTTRTSVNYGALWRTLVLSGELWCTLVHFGALWCTLVHFGELWWTLVNSGEPWCTFIANLPLLSICNLCRKKILFLAYLRSLRSAFFLLRTVVHFGELWRTLVPSGAIWCHLVPSGALWRTLENFIALWRSFALFGALWSTCHIRHACFRCLTRLALR
jgi:hypothetical protein